MKRIGWIFLALALGAALLTHVFGRENGLLLSAFAISFLLGVALLGSSFAARLYRGDVKLRPWDAIKKALLVFVTVLALRLLAQGIFPAQNFDLIEVIIVSGMFAFLFSLYTTAYRRRA